MYPSFAVLVNTIIFASTMPSATLDLLESLLPHSDEIALLSSLAYCIFAVEGCLELMALGYAVDENRNQASTYSRLALIVAVNTIRF